MKQKSLQWQEFTDRIWLVFKRGIPILVAECNGQILGYAYAHRYHRKSCFCLGCGGVYSYPSGNKARWIGSDVSVSKHWKLALKKQGVVNCYALVAEPETEDDYLTFDSLKFHQKMGYHIAGTQHYNGYKFDRWYHMTTLEKFLGEHKKGMTEIKPYRTVE